ncbi:MAG: flagellar filament capping protein FliD [Acidobacteriota bacterium]
MSTTTSAFTGASAYSNDFQAVIGRSIAIRSLGLNALSSGKAQIIAQGAAVSSLDTTFINLQNAVTAIGASTGVSSLSTAVSTTGFVQPALAAGALPGSYSIEVTNLGAATNTISKDALIPVTDASVQNINAGPSFTLTVNGVDTTITPVTANLNGLVAAINANSALNVQASIVNIGPSGAPDYRLSLQSAKLGANTIQLSNGPTLLLDTLSTGTLATYKVNGLATSITSDSRTITLAPGLSVALLQQSPPGVASAIAITKSTTATSNALSAFAVAYNAAVSEVDKNRGTAAGSLAGNSLLSTLSQSLRSISSYSSGAASLPNLTSLGFSFDKSGVLSFDTVAFGVATAGNSTALYTLLGDSTAGFIKSANTALTTLEDPTVGTLKTTIASLTALSTKQDTLIADEQARVEQFRVDLTNRISAADALIASLQQQVTFMTGLFASMLNPKG